MNVEVFLEEIKSFMDEINKKYKKLTVRAEILGNDSDEKVKLHYEFKGSCSNIVPSTIEWYVIKNFEDIEKLIKELKDSFQDFVERRVLGG